MSATHVQYFGKDHWSMLAYVESCCVDGAKGIGQLDRRRVRCNGNTHPLLNANATVAWKDEYSTRLAGFFDFEHRADPAQASAAGLQILGHDDWDCLDDLEAAGFVEILTLANAAVRMTDEGNRVAGLLRTHKANGGQFAQFRLIEALAA
jgi:hypothetical protein